jgi:hypothetical protein
MSYRIGETVIVTREETNHVGVVLDKFIVNKGIMYDVLLENRSAFTMVNTSASNKTYINKYLSGLLCESGMITTTIPYKEMLANDQLPILRAN